MLDPNKIVPNMDGRQYVKSMFFDVTVANMIANGNVLSLSMPPGSEVVGGAINVTQASNETSTDTLSVGDAGNATRYHAAIDFKTVARTTLTATGFRYDATTNAILIKRTPADVPDAATTGAYGVRIDYLQIEEAKFTQG